MFDQFRDGIVLTNDKTGETLVYNQRSFSYMLFGILTHYLRWNPKRAEEKVTEYMLRVDPPTFYTALLDAHDEAYHTARVLAHGEGYWANGFVSEEPDDYDDWYDAFVEKHSLAENTCD